MFEIYTEQFAPIFLPTDQMGNGLMGLDLNISSTAQSLTEHTLAGMPGSIVTGYQDTERSMSISARLKAKNASDFRMQRDKVYAFFKRLGTFYIAEKYQPYKLMKVRVVESYQFSRPENMQKFATVEIPLKIIGHPYWISKFKSTEAKDIFLTDYWLEGMNIDQSKEYQFSSPEFMVFNAGTVPLKTIQEKENCIITISIENTVTNFRLYDYTGRYFEYNPSKDTKWNLAAGNKVILNGHSITANNTPILDRTNRYFLQLQPGENNMKIEGMSSFTITFDFRFKYD